MARRVDFCPSGRCMLDDDARRPITLCAHHQRVKDTNALTDEQIYAAINESGKRLNFARYAAKIELALDKEFPGLPFTVDASGNFTIETGVTGTRLTRARNAVTSRLSGEQSPTGVSTVTVA